MKRVFRTLVAGISVAIAVSACVNFPYQANIQQGNLIETNRVDSIREGMSRTDVANTVGSPILADVFHANRWDYIYTLDKHHRGHEQRRITVWFENDRVRKIERDLPAVENKK